MHALKWGSFSKGRNEWGKRKKEEEERSEKRKGGEEETDNDALKSLDFVVEALLLVDEGVVRVVVLACLAVVGGDEAEEFDEAGLVLKEFRAGGDIVDETLLCSDFLRRKGRVGGKREGEGERKKGEKEG